MTYLGPSLRRRRRAARPWPRFAAALAASLVVNALAFIWAMDSGIVGPLSAARGPRRTVSLAPLSATEWEKNRSFDPRQQPASRPSPLVVAPAPAPPPPPRPEEDKARGQVVDVAPSKDSTRPKDAKYLAEQNSTVEKETRSRYQSLGFQNPMAKPSGPNAGKAVTLLEQKREKSTESGEAGRSGAARPGLPPQPAPKGATRPGLPEQSPRERLALKLDHDGTLRLTEPRPGIAPTPGAQALQPSPQAPEGESGPQALPGKVGPRGALHLMPSAQDYERIAGGPAPDKLDGVEEGEGTYLNTQEFRFAGYYNRISRALRQRWDPGRALEARDPYGQRFPAREYLTGVIVTLDEQGGVKKVTVAQPSGLDFLDQEAVQAFWKAQPFLNPPKGLLGDRHEITLLWGFSVDLHASGMRVQWRGIPRPGVGD